MRTDDTRESSNHLPIVGDSPETAVLREMVARLAGAVRGGVLIAGEPGTGTSHLARALHAAGRRRAMPCLEVCCRDLHAPVTALLGVRGVAGSGLLAAAQGGTLVLAQIDRLDPAVQQALLDALERQPPNHRPLLVGLSAEAAPAGPLGAWLGANRLEIRPLRERPADVLPLARHFLALVARRQERAVRGFSEAAERRLLAHGWPGNVRELRDTVEQAVRVATGPLVDSEALARVVPPAAWLLPGEPRPLREIEDAYIDHVLALTRGNKTRAARVLDIARETLRLRQIARGERRPIAATQG